MKKNPFFNFEPSGLPLQAGNILISAPLSGDLYFDRTVVLLIEHDDKGSFGIVLNRSLPITLQDIFPNDSLQSKHILIFNGGPVSPENLFTLHTYGSLIKGSSVVIDGLYFGGFASQLIVFIKNNFLDEYYIRFYLGYTGWSKGQLESELKKNLWIIGKFEESLLFHNDNTNCWRMAVKSLGKKYSSWLNIAEDPFFN